MTNMGNSPGKKLGSKKGAKKTRPKAPGPEVCKECNRPFYYYPPMPIPPPTAPPKGSNKVLYAVVITIVVIVVLIALGMIGFFYSLTNLASEDDSEEFNSEVIIADGEYFKYLLYDSWWDELEVELDIRSTDGKRYDVYIMDDQQFQNFYENQTVKSFASYYSRENVTQVEDTVKLPSREAKYFLIIDNRDTELTLNDATPSGTITLDVDLKITIKYNIYD